MSSLLLQPLSPAEKSRRRAQTQRDELGGISTVPPAGAGAGRDHSGKSTKAAKALE